MAKPKAPVDLLVPVKWLTRTHPKPLTPDAALLLAYLIWWDEQGNVNKYRLFTCPISEIKRVLGYSARTQTRLILELKDRWCIEVWPERGGRRQISILSHYRPGSSAGARAL